MIGPYLVNSNSRRVAAWGSPCPQAATAGRVTLDGRTFSCHRDAVEAFEAWETVRARHGYRLTGSDTGIYNCRRIRHSTDPRDPWSEHSWGIALDQNWLENPAGSRLVTDMPRALIDDLLRLKTTSGAYVFRWGGDWDRNPDTAHSYYDAMHWGLLAHPLDLATGIIVHGRHEETVTENLRGLRKGDRGAGVQALQATLNAWNPDLRLIEDGIYGDATEAAVRFYQTATGVLAATGHADLETLVWILTNPNRNPATRNRLDQRHAERLAAAAGLG